MTTRSKTKRTTFATLRQEGREPLVPPTIPNQSRRWVLWALIIAIAAIFFWQRPADTPAQPGESEMIIGRRYTEEEEAATATTTPTEEPAIERRVRRERRPRPETEEAAEPTPEAAPEEAPAPAPAPAARPRPRPAPRPVAEAAPTPPAPRQQAAAPRPTPAPAPVPRAEQRGPVRPSFDVIRIEWGELVIAGRAAPGSLVHILDGETEVGRATANSRGEWVFIPNGRLPTGERKLRLFTVDREGQRVYGLQPAVVVISDRPGGNIAITTGGNQPARVLQAPAGADIGPFRVVSLGHNTDGAFRVEGMATSGAKVRIFVDGHMVLETTANSGGAFSGTATHRLEERTTRLRADMIVDGTVTRRVEYRFTPQFFEGDNRSLIVMRGDSLWNIAVREYGRGTDYVVLFEANASHIADPDRIFENQVISIPAPGTDRFTELRRDGATRASGTRARIRQMRGM